MRARGQSFQFFSLPAQCLTFFCCPTPLPPHPVLDLSENCLDAESLPLLASLFREQKQNSRFKDLVLYGNPLSKRAKLDWQTGRETVEEVSSLSLCV